MSESRQRIIDAANELFQGGSFHVIGIAEICEVARVNKGTFYYFFSSKIALLIELLELYVAALLREYEAIARTSDAPAEKLRRIFSIPQNRNEAWKKTHGMAAGCFVGNVCLELASQEPIVREKAEWAFKELSKGLEPIVAEVLKQGGHSAPDASAKSEIVMGMMQGAQVMAKAKNDPTLFSTYSDLAIGMLARQAQLPPSALPRRSTSKGANA